MSDDDPSQHTPPYFGAHAGFVAFPRSSADLTSTTSCPACFAPLTSLVCSRCGLDVGNPIAAQLATTSSEVAAGLVRRLELIGRIRYETEQAARAATRVAEPVASKTPASTWPLDVGETVGTTVAAAPVAVTPAVAPAPPIAPPLAPAVAPVTRAPRRSSVQILLLIVGVTLLSVAAVFFLVYAFITYGLAVRSAIIGGITVASFVVATLLQRRHLRATAEGIAVFSSLLLYLDAIAIRANDLFGTASTDALGYWGATLVASSVILLTWNRLSGLRVPSIVGFASLAPGLGFAAGGLAPHLQPADRTFLVSIVIAAAGIVHPLAARWSTRPERAIAERVVILCTTIAALATALISGLTVGIGTGLVAAPGLALALVGGIAALHLAVAASRPSNGVRRAALAIGAIGTLSLALIGVIVPLRDEFDYESVMLWAPITAAPLAIVLEACWRRAAAPFWKAVAGAAAITAFVVGVAALIAPTVITIGVVAHAIGAGEPAWRISGTARVGTTEALTRNSLLALVAVGVFAIALWAMLRMGRRRASAWILGALVLVAVPALDFAWVVMAAWLVLGLVALGLVIAARRRLGPFVVPVAVFGGAAALLGYAISWSSEDLWYIGTLGMLAALLAARAIVGRGWARATIVGAAAVAFMVGGGALAWQATAPDISIFAAMFDAIAGVTLAAAVLTIVAVALPAIDLDERRALFWIAAPIALSAAVATRVRAEYTLAVDDRARYLVDPHLAAAGVTAIVLVALLGSLALAHRRPELRTERLALAAAIAPSAALAVDAVTWAFGSPTLPTEIGAPLVALLVVAAGLVSSLVSHEGDRTLRLASDLGAAATVALWAALQANRPPVAGTPWLALLILAVAVLLAAISPDGLFGSASRRRLVGWLALAIGTAALWVRLGGDHVTVLEPYVLPLAGALLVVAALLDRVARMRTPQAKAAPAVALAALLIGMVPLALEAGSGDELRPALVGLAGAIALIVGVTLAPKSAAQRDYLAVLAATGALGVLIVGAGRAIADRFGGRPAWDLWIIGSMVLVAVAALIVEFRGRRRSSTGSDESASAELPRTIRAIAVTLTGAILVVMFAMIESPTQLGNGATSAPYGRWREVVVVIVLSAALVAIVALSERTRMTGLGWITLAAAVFIVGSGLLLPIDGEAAFSPVETGTVPIALGLIVVGIIRMRRVESAGSWRHLGAGIAVLVGPSLLATLFSTSDRPLWRLIGLGALAIALVVVGVARRLQAPLVLGSVVVIVHAISTFADQIRTVYESVPWWLWLGVGGILIIVLAARYEQRIRNVRNVALRIGALR